MLTLAAVALAAVLAHPASADAPSVPPGFCSANWATLTTLVGSPGPAAVEAPEYYAFPMVTTKRVPGSGSARGRGRVSFADSPFGIALAQDGSYLLDVWLSVDRLAPPREGAYVAWVTTTNLDQIQRVGRLGDDGRVQGRVQWNKFLLVLTLEPADDPTSEAWTGPVVMRGMSRSGQMHTMAGHGAFEQENCAVYGYG